MGLTLSACSKGGSDNEVEAMSRTELFMGTSVKITLYNHENEESINKAFERIKEIEDTVSINKEGTEIGELNKNAGVRPVKLSKDSIEIIEKGLHYSNLSKGSYDISIGPLVKLWSIGLPEAKVPTENEIKEVLENIDYSKVKINDEEVFLEEKEMILDLGSIAKGYAADEVVEVLENEGVEKAVIDLGGNIYVMGEKAKNQKWKIGVQNPFADRGSAIGSILLSDKSIVTTGVYERYIEDGDAKYHHVLDPKTGYPYETEIAGVTIIADKSIDADSLSTLVFTKGIDEGLEFIESIDGVEAIFVSNSKEIYKSVGIKDSFNLLNEDFKVMN
ncbi:FAD:protein FMN transferase [uncultured Clostridium sp.]|uniref:FAD:protein FMN transferase n=1 Tax=uncultured Clostridium sp. TaxID=59620 RepID=UPI0026252477|nr:FAD:protein FMN transferase [uncultured Clostridium sp.]